MEKLTCQNCPCFMPDPDPSEYPVCHCQWEPHGPDDVPPCEQEEP